MRKKLQDYLPPVLLTTCEFPLLCLTGQAEMDALISSTDEVLDCQFITTAPLRGVERYEKIYGIVPQDTDTLEERRFRILTHINAQLPYTIRVLHQRLQALCGEDGYSLTLNHGTYTLTVKVALTAKRNLQAVQEMLAELTPANLVVSCSLLYNQHQTLAAYTHGQLAAYTHNQLKNEVLLNA